MILLALKTFTTNKTIKEIGTKPMTQKHRDRVSIWAWRRWRRCKIIFASMDIRLRLWAPVSAILSRSLLWLGQIIWRSLLLFETTGREGRRRSATAYCWDWYVHFWEFCLSCTIGMAEFEHLLLLSHRSHISTMKASSSGHSIVMPVRLRSLQMQWDNSQLTQTVWKLS